MKIRRTKSPNIVEPSNDEPADLVGSGISIDAPTRVVKPEPKVPVTPVVKLDGTPEWSDTPSVAGQIGMAGMFRITGRAAKVFDLAVEDELEAYNALLSKAVSPATNVFLTGETQQFCEQTGNWKILVQYQTVQFKKIIKDTKR